MPMEGAEVGIRMLLVHQVEMSQAARYPGSGVAERVERRVMIRPQGSRTWRRVGSLLLKAGLRLQERARSVAPQRVPLGTTAVQR